MSMSKESQYARRVRERDEARAEVEQLKARLGVGIERGREMVLGERGNAVRYRDALLRIQTEAGTASPGQIRQIVRDALGDDA